MTAYHPTKRSAAWLDVHRLCPRCGAAIRRYGRSCQSCGLLVRNVQGRVIALPNAVQKKAAAERKARREAQLRLNTTPKNMR